MIALDTSRSMLAQDLRPSRLERAKRDIKGLLDHLEGDRVALVAFSGDARDVAPLTRDRGTLEGLLGFVAPEDNQLGGTNVAAAIEHGLALFDGRTGAHEALVLLTDGEDLEGKGLELAEEALQRKIRIYVVGVGTEAGGKIPVPGRDGKTTLLKDSEGNEVVTRLERASLEALAAKTGGAYLSAEDSPTPLEDLYRARISSIERRELEGGERRVPYDRFQWALVPGLACLLLELGLRARARVRSATGVRPRLAAALLPLALVGGEEGLSVERSLANAVRHRNAGELEAAELSARSILKEADALALGEEPRARAHFALGVITAARAAGEEAEDKAEPDWTAALEAFGSARALAGPGALRLDAIYDLGAVELERAERLRAKIPEIAGPDAAAPAQPPALPQGAQPGAPGADAPEPPPDALPLARARYLASKGWLIERLRADWQDEDVRADLELVQRRLHELERIEEERKKKQDEQQQGKDQQDPNQDRQKQDPDKQDQDQPNQDQQQQDQQDQDQQAQDGQPKDPKEDEEGKPEPSEEPQDQAAKDKEGDQASASEAEPQERLLTREEVLQLLDKLADLEKQQKALEAALRAKRRPPVKRDW